MRAIVMVSTCAQLLSRPVLTLAGLEVRLLGRILADGRRHAELRHFRLAMAVSATVQHKTNNNIAFNAMQSRITHPDIAAAVGFLERMGARCAVKRTRWGVSRRDEGVQ